MDFAEDQSVTLVNFAKRLAQEASAEYHYLQGAHRKDRIVDTLQRQRPISDEMICLLSSRHVRRSLPGWLSQLRRHADGDDEIAAPRHQQIRRDVHPVPRVE